MIIARLSSIEYYNYSKNDAYSSRLLAGFSEVNLGYIAWLTKRSNIAPLLGIGWLGYSLHMQKKSQIPSGFDNALSSFGGERHLQTDMNFYLTPSLAYI